MHAAQTIRGEDQSQRSSGLGSSLSRCVFLFFGSIGVACAQTPPAVVLLSSLGGSQGWALDGPEFLARAGAAIDGNCDLNADGIRDLLIGATGAGPSDQGMAFVVFGSPTGAAPPTSLNSAGLRMTGETSGDAAGASVACAGDVNGDDVDDVLIGAPFADAPSVANTGAAYLVFGSESLPSAISLDDADVRIHGMFNTQKIGAVLAGGGDINGDRYADIVLTAPNFSAGAGNPGQAYVIFGSNSLPPVFALSTLNGSNGFAVASTEVSTVSLGTAAAIGLINGDNFPDVVLGAPGASPGGVASAGSVFVVYGHSGAFPLQTGLNTLNGSNGLAIHSAVAGDKAGGSLSFVPDFNGDARPDLVIGAPGAANGTSRIGNGYVVFGAASFSPGFNLSGLNGGNGLAFTSAAAGDVLGESVAGLHDINGDGLGEVIFGAPGADFGLVNSGGAYVVFGRSSGLPANFALSSLTGSNGFRIQGATTDDFAGQTVCRAGDINQDGIADLFVGSPEADPNNTMSAGRVYALFGNDFVSNDPLFKDGFE